MSTLRKIGIIGLGGFTTYGCYKSYDNILSNYNNSSNFRKNMTILINNNL